MRPFLFLARHVIIRVATGAEKAFRISPVGGPRREFSFFKKIQTYHSRGEEVLIHWSWPEGRKGRKEKSTALALSISSFPWAPGWPGRTVDGRHHHWTHGMARSFIVLPACPEQNEPWPQSMLGFFFSLLSFGVRDIVMRVPSLLLSPLLCSRIFFLWWSHRADHVGWIISAPLGNP